MVCRKCGSDLKPGIKYCLNCGEYLTQEELNILETGEVNNADASLDFSQESDINFNESENKDGKLSKKAKDIIIYSILFAILIGSILVIIFSSKEEVIIKEQPPVTYQDNIVKVGNYKITFSGKLRYAVSGSIVHIEDDKNYSIAYKVVSERIESYTEEFLSNDLISKGNKVINVEKRKVEDTDFIIITFEDSKNKVRYLYVCKVDENHVAMGNIAEKENGNWEGALLTIVKINNSIEFLS